MSGAPILAETKHAFLERLATGHPVAAVCRDLGINRASIYHARYADVEFGRAWELCLQIDLEAVRDEVLRKAMAATGRIVEEPLLDEDGCPVLDDDFEPVVMRRLVDYDARILAKLIDKRVPSVDGPNQTNVQVNSTTTVHTATRRMPRLVQPTVIDQEDAIFETAEEADDDGMA